MPLQLHAPVTAGTCEFELHVQSAMLEECSRANDRRVDCRCCSPGIFSRVGQVSTAATHSKLSTMIVNGFRVSACCYQKVTN